MNKNKILSIVVLGTLLFSLSSAIDVSFSCPDSAELNKEFSCQISISPNGDYDLKAEITEQGKTISQIYNPSKENWQSSFYYILGFNSDELQLKITKGSEGDRDGVLKIRENSKIIYSENFSISLNAQEPDSEEAPQYPNAKPSESEQPLEQSQGINPQEEHIQTSENIINLNPQSNTELKSAIIYESKNEKIRKIALISFSLFLIFIIILLLIRK